MFGLGKHSLPEDLFRGACDVHCHLLPGVDDGFSTLEKSLHALKKLEERGIKKMVFTPHFMKDYPDNHREAIMAKFETYKAEAAKVCGVELHLAAEYMLDACFMDHFKEGFLTLDKGGNHVLCETSYMMYEHGITEMIYEIMCAEFQPVIAHPERYEYANKDNYFRWKDKNYKFQLNLLSLAGAYGGNAVAKSQYLLKEGFYDYVGSDMHGLSNFERFLPEIRLNNKSIEQLERLIENNKKLVG
jgi:tyrosine-protein phosphatase YwqE